MGPLDGVRILEVAQGVGGPYCGKLLAGLGATVVKVEPPEVGDETRRLGPKVPGVPEPESSALFQHLNTGKQSVAIDIETPGGREVLFEIIHRWADVVISSYPRRNADEFGLRFANLKDRSPALVLVSVTDFGLTGPYADYVGSEIAALAIGGYLYLTGEPTREPLKPWGYQARYHAGLHAATGAVAALLRAEATGEGDEVDATAVEAAAYLSSAAPGWAYFYGQDPTRAGNRLANLDPKQFYPSTMRPCRDGWVHAHNNVRDPELLQVLMGDPELGRPDIVAEPKGHADEIDAIMDRWLANYDRAEVVEMAQTLRVPFTEVFTPEEVVRDEHLSQRQTLIDIEHPVLGRMRVPHAPLKFSETPWTTDRAPLLGEHTATFLQEVLGMSPVAIDELTTQKVSE